MLRLKELRENQGKGQKEVAIDLGVSQPTVSAWEAGTKTPSSWNTQRLADYFGVSTDYLLGRDALPLNMEPMPKMKKVPILGTIACGNPIVAIEEHGDFALMPEDIRADFVLRCRGDSMINARIFDGDIVYIRQQPVVNDGQIAAVEINGEATLKRVRLFPDHIVLEPCNPRYQPLVYWHESMTGVNILGLAVAFTSTVLPTD